MKTKLMDQAKTDAGKAVAEMMGVWGEIRKAAKKQFPKASEEELFQICSGAMNHALGLDRR